MKRIFNIVALVCCSVLIAPIYIKYNGNFFAVLAPFVGIVSNGFLLLANKYDDTK